MTTERIDVLDVMQRASLRLAELSQGCKTATEAALQEARAAVAELIEAGNAYVAARSAYNDAVNSRGLVGQRDARLAMEAAKKRHIAILARVGGAS